MGAFRHRRQQTGLAYDLIPPEAQQPKRSLRRFERSDDIIDAEFVIVQPGRTGNRWAGSGNDNRRRDAPPSGGMAGAALLSALVFFLRAGESWLQRASGRSFAVLIAALFVLVFGLVGGFSGLSAPPPVHAPPIATAPLQFTNVSLTPRDANGMHILVLNGIIDNVTAEGRFVPQIRADLFMGDQLATSVIVSPPVDRIGGGESRGFSARLPHPGEKMPEVRLSFVQAGADGR